jgi:capsular polysaccharide biosynthesis protein
LQNKEYIEDEIDLRELFQTIWNSKKFIVIFTFVITLLAVIYVFLKNPTPIYQGKVFVEIGQIQSQNFGQSLLDTPGNLATILELEFDVNTSIPKGTNNLLEISSNNIDKETIKNNLGKSVEFILNRHKENAKFYENVIMTKQIGDTSINNTPINTPKKKLIVIVAFITGFILSIFLVFFMQFISGMKKEEK